MEIVTTSVTVVTISIQNLNPELMRKENTNLFCVLLSAHHDFKTENLILTEAPTMEIHALLPDKTLPGTIIFSFGSLDAYYFYFVFSSYVLFVYIMYI